MSSKPETTYDSEQLFHDFYQDRIAQAKKSVLYIDEIIKVAEERAVNKFYGNVLNERFLQLLHKAVPELAEIEFVECKTISRICRKNELIISNQFQNYRHLVDESNPMSVWDRHFEPYIENLAVEIKSFLIANNYPTKLNVYSNHWITYKGLDPTNGIIHNVVIHNILTVPENDWRKNNTTADTMQPNSAGASHKIPVTH